MGKYAGSMRTRALSGAETIHVNGEVLEYLIQGNQHGYCAVHAPQCRTYGTIPYAVCRMKYVREHEFTLLSNFVLSSKVINHWSIRGHLGSLGSKNKVKLQTTSNENSNSVNVLVLGKHA